MHVPVLLKEVIEYLAPKPGDTILDATIDGGGHAREILKCIGTTGRLIGIEQDKEILRSLASKLEARLLLVNENFRNLDKVLERLKIKKIDGALFDLGMSTLQLEESGRGFSFKKDEPLLMTFKSDIELDTLTAKQIVNSWSEKDIADVLYKYGEERYSRRIAKGIVGQRREKKIETTFELVGIIQKSVPKNYCYSRIHCATKTFQALRIAVNDELNALEEGIRKAWNALNKRGRMVVISFHSLEDRIVKNFFRNLKKEGEVKILTKKPVTASQEEIILNPASRSAKLRAMENL